MAAHREAYLLSRCLLQDVYCSRHRQNPQMWSVVQKFHFPPYIKPSIKRSNFRNLLCSRHHKRYVGKGTQHPHIHKSLILRSLTLTQHCCFLKVQGVRRERGKEGGRENLLKITFENELPKATTFFCKKKVVDLIFIGTRVLRRGLILNPTVPRVSIERYIDTRSPPE